MILLDVRFSLQQMANRQESTPLPALPGYVFGERLGAGSYGTVYKARLIPVSVDE